MRYILGIFSVAVLCTPALSSTVADYNFATGGTTGVQGGDPTNWDFTITGLSDNGVSFNAIVTVQGNSTFGSNTVNRTGQGLGTGGQAGLQLGDVLQVSVAVTNVSAGGSVTIDGFTGAVLNSSSATSQDAEFHDGLLTPLEAFLSTPFNTVAVSSANSPLSVNFAQLRSPFTVTTDSTVNPGFHLQGVSVQFTAVPEPKSMAMMGMGLASVMFLSIGFRRRNHRQAQVTM